MRMEADSRLAPAVRWIRQPFQEVVANGARLLLLLVIAGSLIGCARPDVSDLEQFVQETRNNQKGRIEPLPQFKPFDTYEYAAARLRDPFVTWSDAGDESRQARVGSGPQPDMDRRKESLEQYPLDSLRMVGVLEKDSQEWAVIRTPDGLVYRVQEGNYMGQNHGRILSLSQDKIELKELVPDGLGGWIERQAMLTLADE